MDVRAQIVMAFHLDKCIGCHTCSISCKNIWTDRDGAEYMWWNNVETKPGLGYPQGWEAQQASRGGGLAAGKRAPRKSWGKASPFSTLSSQPTRPEMEDNSEP